MRIRKPIERSYGHTAMLGSPVAAALLMLGSGTAVSDTRESEEITVRRINIVEPDGSLKLVIGSSARMHPGAIGGVDLPQRQRPAGILFFDDRGDEAGGLGIVGDQRGRYGGIVVDQLDNDETMRLVSQQVMTSEGLVHRAGLGITDRNPDFTLPQLMALMEEVQKLPSPEEQQARFDELEAEHGPSQADRMFVGRSGQGGVLVDLRDASGVTRLRMSVTDEGDARIEFLDEHGAVLRTLTADS